MRILHVTSTFFPDTHGGIEEVIRQISINTKHLGVESRVFTLSNNPDPDLLKIDGIDVLRSKKTLEIASCGLSIEGFLKFKNQVFWADIIHYHFPWPYADMLHLFSNVKKKSIITYHSDVIRQKKLKYLYSPLMHLFLKNINQIVATSDNYLETSSVLNIYKDKTSVIPIGINQKTYPDISNSDLASMESKVGRDFFLFIGSLRRYKGLDVLLRAVNGLNLHFVIAGTGALEKELIQQAKKLNLSNVTFLKQVSDIEKVALLTLCKSVVFSSTQRSEAFGVALIEGSMFGKPLISTEIGTGTSYINLDGETGIVVPPLNIKALKDAMIKLDSDAILAKKMGYAAKLRFENLFTGQLMGKKYFEAYKGLLS